jgi:hypothetical protein
MSSYIFKGRLCGYLCGDCTEPLSGVKIRLYRLREGQNAVALAVASPKDTLAVLSEEEVKGKSGNLLAEVEADADGRFSFDLGEKQKYKGEAFEIDVYCGTVPGLRPGRVPPKPRQLSVTTVQPLWRQREDAALAVWDYCIPYRFWCYFRGLFGAWTICGHLKTCAAPHSPIAGATVKAFDADWLQDDALGSAVTDASGHFRIDYLSSDFKKDILGLNVELFGGPDVYFSAELGGISILSETQQQGRVPGRENISNCFCVELCSDEVQPPDVEHIPHWQQVEIFDIHPNPSATGFSTEGYAGGAANSFVFGGGVTLKGNCPLRNFAAPANPLEYRFRIGEWTWSGGVDDPATIPNVAPAIMTDVTQIQSTHVGYVFYTNGLGLSDSAPVYVTAADLLPGGWIRIDNKAVTVDMRNGTTAVVNVNNPAGNFLRTFDLFVVNTPAITSAHPAKLPGGLPILQAGRALTTAEREPIRRYRLMFEVRDGVSLAPVASDVLDSIVFDNSPVAFALDLEELRTNACSPVSAGTVHILYTIDHPHLRFFNLGISNNSGTVHGSPPLPGAVFVPPPPATNYLFRGGSGGPHLPGNNGGFAVNVSGDAACAYRVALGWQTRHYLSSATSTDRLYCK